MRKRSKEPREVLLEWVTKLKFIESDIKTIEESTSGLTISVSLFLLKTQLIEFQLRHLLTSLTLYLRQLSGPNSLVRIKQKVPKDFEKPEYTLGVLIKILDNFEGESLDLIKNDLNSLNAFRKKFTHQLFDMNDSIEELVKDTHQAVPLANRIRERINNLEKRLFPEAISV